MLKYSNKNSQLSSIIWFCEHNFEHNRVLFSCNWDLLSKNPNSFNYFQSSIKFLVLSDKHGIIAIDSRKNNWKNHFVYSAYMENLQVLVMIITHDCHAGNKVWRYDSAHCLPYIMGQLVSVKLWVRFIVLNCVGITKCYPTLYKQMCFHIIQYNSTL